MIRFFGPLTLILLLLLPSLTQGRELSFAQALEVSKDSPGYKSLGEDLAAAKGDYLNAFGNYLPKATGGLTFYKSLDLPSFLFPAGPGGQLVPITIGQPYNFSAQLDLSQIVWHGGAFFGILAAKKSVDAQRGMMTYNRQKFGISLAEVYYGAVLAKEGLAVAQQSYTIAQKAVSKAELAFQNGLLSPLDLKIAQVKVQGIRPQILEAENGANDALRYLKLTLGVPLDQEIVLSDSLGGVTPPEPVPLDSLIREAQTQRGDMQALDATRDAMSNLVTAGWMSYVPSLAAFYQLKHAWADSLTNPTDAMDLRSSMVGASLNWNIFDGLSAVGTTKKALANRRKIDHQREQALEGVALSLTSIEAKRQQTWASIQAADSLVANAGDVVAQVENRLANGKATTLDLDNARLDLQSARLSLAKAKYDYLLASLKFKVETGRVTFPQLQ